MKTSFNAQTLKPLIAVAVLFGCLLVMHTYPIKSLHETWTGYRALVLSAKAEEKQIIQKIEEQGIDDYVTESNSTLISLSPEAPIQPHIPALNSARSKWFLNEQYGLRYVYLKETAFLESKISVALASSPYEWTLEKTGGFTIMPLLIILTLVGSALLVLKKPGVVIIGVLPLFGLAAAHNRFSGLLASLLLSLCILMVQYLLTNQGTRLSRLQIKDRLIAQPTLIIPALVALVTSVLSGFHSLLLLSMACLASLTTIYLASRIGLILRKTLDSGRLHPPFVPLSMTPAPSGLVWLKKEIIILATTVMILAMLGGLLFSLNRNPSRSSSVLDLYIPAPSGYTKHSGFTIESYMEWTSLKKADNLPDLGDYIVAQWQIQTYPWHQITSSMALPQKGITAEYPEYIIDDKGIISEKKRVMATFDTDFIKKTLYGECTPLEKMLIRQNRFVTVDYMRPDK